MDAKPTLLRPNTGIRLFTAETAIALYLPCRTRSFQAFLHFSYHHYDLSSLFCAASDTQGGHTPREVRR